jgi:hypothetical protein
MESSGDDGIMEFDWFMTMEHIDLLMGAIVGSSDNKFINSNGKGFCTTGHYNAIDHK